MVELNCTTTVTTTTATADATPPAPSLPQFWTYWESQYPSKNPYLKQKAQKRAKELGLPDPYAAAPQPEPPKAKPKMGKKDRLKKKKR